MTKFEIRNALMTMVFDDTEAYKIAIAFVNDDSEKLTVFQRCWHSFGSQDMEEKATLTKEKSERLWLFYIEP